MNPVLFEDKKLIEMRANARPGQDIEEGMMVPTVPAEAYDPQKKREKKLLDNKRAMRPEKPIQGPGKGGRVPQSGTLAQYVMQGLIKNE
jgi:hypothetical protein